MIGFNFGQISNILSTIMDSDYIDIKRDFGSELLEVYSNIPCHVTYKTIENPDINSVDIKPIVQSIIVHLDNWVDIRNNDYLVVKKMSNDNNILEVYSGRCGNPMVSQSRQKVMLIMSATQSEIPTPVPPENGVKIKISFFADDTEIEKSTIQEVAIGSTFNYNVPEIEGYSFSQLIVDGEVVTDSSITIDSVEDRDYDIKIIYVKSQELDYFRFLLNGLFTKNDGTLTSGYHLLKKVNIINYTLVNDVYEIECKDVNYVHEDNGKILNLNLGTKLVLFPDKIFVEIIKREQINGNQLIYCSKFNPTQLEENAIVTKWYD